MSERFRTQVLAACVFFAPVVNATEPPSNTETAGESISVWKRHELLPRQNLDELGITLRLSWTQFFQNQLQGDGEHTWDAGGRGDLHLTSDLSKLGFWQGFSFSLHGQGLVGEDVNTQGDGSVLPINTALAFPRLSGGDWDFSSAFFTQRFQGGATLSVGKLDMLDVAARTPLVGGGGIETFQNLAFAAPPSGLVPASILGAFATMPVRSVNLTIAVYDPSSATRKTGLDDPFEDGVTGLVSVGMSSSFGGLPGHHSLSAKANDKVGLDLEDLRGLELPPVSEVVLGEKEGAWNVAYSYQQYLQVDSSDPRKGWGVFLQVGRSDGNPTPIDWSGHVGIGGNSPIPGRSDDRFGVGYFYLGLSDDLTAGLNRIGNALGVEELLVQSESGLEAYYNAAITPWFRLSLNLQVIDPHESRKGTAVFGGLRAQILF
jgi:porin